MGPLGSPFPARQYGAKLGEVPGVFVSGLWFLFFGNIRCIRIDLLEPLFSMFFRCWQAQANTPCALCHESHLRASAVPTGIQFVRRNRRSYERNPLLARLRVI